MTQPDEQEPTVEETLASLKGLWFFALATPALYMLIGLAVGHWVFAYRKQSGFAPVPENGYRWLLVATACVSLVLTSAVVWTRHLRDQTGRAFLKAPTGVATNRSEEYAPALRLYQRRTFWMLTISDFVGFLGLTLYLVQGDALAQGILSALAWINYALSKPKERRGDGRLGDAER